MKIDKLLILGLLFFGAYYLYDKRKEKPVEATSDKEDEVEEEATTKDGITSSGGGVLPNRIKPISEKIVDKKVGVIDVKLPLKKDEIKSPPKKIKKDEIQYIKGGMSLKPISSGLDSKQLLNNLQLKNKKNKSILPTTKMGGDSKVKKTTVSLKSIKNNIPIKSMSNFYFFDGDGIDNEQFLIN